MAEDEEMTPFWLQQTNRGSRGRRGSGNQISSTFLNSGLFLIVSVLALASVIVFIIIPSIVGFTSQILKLHNVKKSWDSLNLVLVLFAIVCGFLSRNTIQDTNSSSSYNTIQQQEDRRKSNPTTPRRWNYEYDQDRLAYNSTSSFTTSSLSRLRSFRSYPDLRQESIWADSGEERWRFYDDTHLRNHHQDAVPDQLHREFHRERPRQQLDHDEATEAAAKPEEILMETKDVVAINTFVTNPEEVNDHYFSPPLTSPLRKSTPSPLPSPATELEDAGKSKVKRTYYDPGSEKRTQRKEVQVVILAPPEKAGKKNVKRAQRKEVQVPIFTPAPATATSGKSEKTRGKDMMKSVKGKKKNLRQKSVEKLDAFFDPLRMSSPAKVSYLQPPSPPPPPPPPTATTSARRYPIPAKSIISQRVEESFGSGGMSPLRPIPPPPPPPPFKMPAWKFVVEGDYVRVGSFGSSRSGSPDLDSPDDGFSDRESPVAGAGAPAMTLFCPSPDVDTKADNFIARFRAGLKLEKSTSVKGRSNLGPSPSAFGINTR